MYKRLLLCFSLAAQFVLPAAHPAAKNGKAEMLVVYKKTANPKNECHDHVYKRYNTTDLTARELASHLQKITGAEFSIVEETAWDQKQPAFLIGQTDFAKKNGLDFSKFDKEEWLYKSIGKNIVIGGGFNWGNDLALYKFLQEELGCLWLSYECTYIPQKKDLTIPELDRRGTPSFINRVIYIPPAGQKSKRLEQLMHTWLRRNRSNFQRLPQGSSDQYTSVHSFYEFVDPGVYFKTHPEYFGMNSLGKRVAGTRKSRLGGQLCLSNPEVRKITERKLREYIAGDRANKPREKWPVIYEISQCDNTDYICHCPECKKITTREGSDSGLLLHFLNPIAESIAKDYPEIRISTYVYVSTEKAPKYIKAAKNISLRWCDLYFNSDCYRPLSHSINKKQKKIFEDWTARGIVVDSIWDYWNMGGRWINPPRVETMLDAIAPDLRYFHSRGVRYYFTEMEHSYADVDTNFLELQVWLGQQLLDDITKDEKQLVATFMKHYFGPAEKPMTAALNIIRKEVAAEKRPMFYTGNIFQKFLTPAFILAVRSEMEKAIALTPPGSAWRMRVEKEMLPVLRTQAFYDALRLGKTKQQIMKEYRTMRERQLKYRYTAKELPSVLKIMENELKKLEFDFPTPEKFKHLPPESIRKFTAIDFRGVQVNDPESTLKKVIRIGSREKDKDQVRHANPKDTAKYIVGMHNFVTKNEVWHNLKNELKKDGKYNWYCIRNFHFGSKTQFFAWGWWTLCDLSKVYADGSDNRWDIWFSLKAVGPAYATGEKAKEENNFFIESIILTKPGAIQ
ncbi:MAG: DUF4838 domain-containing protein [Lentisphaeria bacterium]|nr:DUF4838 domain-containing protein [Lentisphaeria bacterium]